VSTVLHLDKDLVLRREFFWQDYFMINSGDLLSFLLTAYFVVFAHEFRPGCTT